MSKSKIYITFWIALFICGAIFWVGNLESARLMMPPFDVYIFNIDGDTNNFTLNKFHLKYDFFSDHSFSKNRKVVP